MERRAAHPSGAPHAPRRWERARLLAVLATLVATLACSGEEKPAESVTPQEYEAAVADWRREKDRFFRSSPDSPMPSEQRAGFRGLDYYPVDPSWALVLPFIRDPRSERVFMITNTGESRAYQREGYVELARQGRSVRVHLYREAGGGRSATDLWVPFVDAGAGRETYSGGRYLDARLFPDGTALLDFNYSHNPYCAYGWNYSCPLTPRENHLPIGIPAGERGFHREPSEADGPSGSEAGFEHP